MFRDFKLDFYKNKNNKFNDLFLEILIDFLIDLNIENVYQYGYFNSNFIEKINSYCVSENNSYSLFLNYLDIKSSKLIGENNNLKISIFNYDIDFKYTESEFYFIFDKEIFSELIKSNKFEPKYIITNKDFYTKDFENQYRYKYNFFEYSFFSKNDSSEFLDKVSIFEDMIDYLFLLKENYLKYENIIDFYAENNNFNLESIDIEINTILKYLKLTNLKDKNLFYEYIEELSKNLVFEKEYFTEETSNLIYEFLKNGQK